MNINSSRNLINQILGDGHRNVEYPKELPSDLLLWHCYPIDCGHSIMAVLESAYLQDQPIENSLLPIPVKTVLDGYKLVDGYVFCINPKAKYNPDLGLEYPSEDIEF